MTQIKVKYLGELRTEAEHIQSGNKIINDAPIDNNGRGEAFSPTDTVCAALATCMMTIMGIVAKRENLELKGLSADVVKVMASNPRKISEIQISFFKSEETILSEKQKEVLKRAALTCPVALSLDPAIKQIISFDF
jgi:putative redox protein